MSDDIKILFKSDGADYILDMPTFYNFLEFKAGNYKQVWHHLTIDDPPKNYKIILNKVFRELFPDGFLNIDVSSDIFEKNIPGDINEIFINLMLSFGYKPHELLHLNPYELSFAVLMYEAKNKYLDYLERLAASK